METGVFFSRFFLKYQIKCKNCTLTDLAKVKLERIKIARKPIKKQIRGMYAESNKQIRGVRKRSACSPNLELPNTKKTHTDPKVIFNSSLRPRGKIVKIKKTFTITSEKSLGVKSKRGPMLSLVKNSGEVIYKRIISETSVIESPSLSVNI